MLHLYTEEELRELQEEYIEKVRRENWDEAVDEMLSENRKEYFEHCDELKRRLERLKDLAELPPEDERKLLDCYNSMDDAWTEVEKTTREAAEEWFRRNKELRRKLAERQKEAETNAVAEAKRIVRKKKRQIAKNILAKEVMTFDEIAECVGLPVDEVERLADAMV